MGRLIHSQQNSTRLTLNKSLIPHGKEKNLQRNEPKKTVTSLFALFKKKERNTTHTHIMYYMLLDALCFHRVSFFLCFGKLVYDSNACETDWLLCTKVNIQCLFLFDLLSWQMLTLFLFLEEWGEQCGEDNKKIDYLINNCVSFFILQIKPTNNYWNHAIQTATKTIISLE